MKSCLVQVTLIMAECEEYAYTYLIPNIIPIPEMLNNIERISTSDSNPWQSKLSDIMNVEQIA